MCQVPVEHALTYEIFLKPARCLMAGLLVGPWAGRGVAWCLNINEIMD